MSLRAIADRETRQSGATYGSILPGAVTLARLLPNGASEARAQRPLSRDGKRRLVAVLWHESHGKNVGLTARHFSISRSSLYVWLERYRLAGQRGLEDKSRRPRNVRQPSWSPALEAAVLRLREENPCRGKDKFTPICGGKG